MIQHLKPGKPAEQKAQIDANVRATVEGILGDIEKRGEVAVREYSRKFDQWDPASFRLTSRDIADCISSLPRQAIEDIRFAQTQIKRFAQVQRNDQVARTPLARLAAPAEVAQAVVVAATHFTFSTGTVLAVDGGRPLA